MATSSEAAFPLILTIIIIFLHHSSASSLSTTAAILSKQSFSSSSQNKIKICSLSNRPSSCSSQLNHFNPFSTISDDHDQKIADSSSSSFFKQSSLLPGTKILDQEPHEHYYYFPKRAKEVILVSRSFPPNSTEESINSTLIHYCNSLATKNSKFSNCLKSLTEMIEFSRNALGGGKKKKLVGLTTKGIKVINEEVGLVIGGVRKMGRSKIVSCHGVLLDSPAYFCHLVSSTEVYVVDVIDRVTGSPVNRVLAACHMDTSSWSKDHVAFKILNSSPGMTEVCHWNTDLDLVWV